MTLLSINKHVSRKSLNLEARLEQEAQLSIASWGSMDDRTRSGGHKSQAINCACSIIVVLQPSKIITLDVRRLQIFCGSYRRWNYDLVRGFQEEHGIREADSRQRKQGPRSRGLLSLQTKLQSSVAEHSKCKNSHPLFRAVWSGC